MSITICIRGVGATFCLLGVTLTSSVAFYHIDTHKGVYLIFLSRK